jgi:hypothetical protein
MVKSPGKICAEVWKLPVILLTVTAPIRTLPDFAKNNFASLAALAGLEVQRRCRIQRERQSINSGKSSFKNLLRIYCGVLIRLGHPGESPETLPFSATVILKLTPQKNSAHLGRQICTLFVDLPKIINAFHAFNCDQFFTLSGARRRGPLRSRILLRELSSRVTEDYAYD